MNTNFKNYLLEVTKSKDCKESYVIQSLWSGYGKISRYELLDSAISTVVVKCISLSEKSNHPRGWNTNTSHNRKRKSYEVETHWYKTWNSHCGILCKTPSFVGSFQENENQWIVMEDLKTEFPVCKQHLTLNEAKVCLKWLANFHGTFFGKKPLGLWQTGTYWNLETRPDEFKKIEYLELKEKANEIDLLLNTCTYQTIVHGDAKVANFCFSGNGKNVAAVDFQYVGGGCGMKDVAYFLGSCLTSSECEMHEKELLNFYFNELEKSIDIKKTDFIFTEIEQEWRELYPVACADFTRFLLGWMPSHDKVNSYNLKKTEKVLQILN